MNRMRFVTLLALALAALPLRSQAADDYAGQRASLWRGNSIVNSLYTDPKARGVNDIVMISVSESSSASNKAGLTTSKKNSTSMGIDSFLGLETDLKGKLTDSFDPKSLFGATTNNSNEGSGEATRSSTLSTYIAARVVDVMPNGNLVIEARKEVMVNKEKQTVVLRGIVRPRDISYDNVVASSAIADMQINFAGRGPVSEQTRRGWLSWILNLVWPF